MRKFLGDIFKSLKGSSISNLFNTYILRPMLVVYAFFYRLVDKHILRRSIKPKRKKK